MLLGLTSITGLVAALTAGCVGLLRRRPQWFALGGLSTGLILAHALLTHAIPRYTRPAGGTMLLIISIAVVLLIDNGLTRGRRMFRSRRQDAAGRQSEAAGPTPRS